MLLISPEANAEVRRNILLGTGAIAGLVILMVVILAVAIVPAGGGIFATRFASLMLMVFCLPVSSIIGTCLTLAYVLDFWPGFLRPSKVEALYGVPASLLKDMSIKRWRKTPNYWASLAKGIAVAFLFVVPWFGIHWATSSRGFPEGFVCPALLILFFAGGLAARACVVRDLVSRREFENCLTPAAID